MDAFDLRAKANECRLLAVDAQGDRRDKLLALADEYDSIRVALDALKSEQPIPLRDEHAENDELH